VITLKAPLIVLDDSRVTSLTGDNEPLPDSGQARLLGDVTVISPDSDVAASSEVTVSGLENEVGARLAVTEGAFLDAGELLRERCAARGSGAAPPSRFTAAGRGGRPPDPAGPLAAPYREPEEAVGNGEAEAAAEPPPGAGPTLQLAVAEGCNPDPGG
jgi:hypothetical protein